MREADRLEVGASSGWTAEEALTASLAASVGAWALVAEDGEVLALFGVQPLHLLSPERVGVVWALTGTGVGRYPVSFYRVSLAVADALSDAWPTLQNYVDARYRRAVRWLLALGFTVLPAVPFGREGRPFHPVVLRRRPRV
jgi:hypothetical protein